ncbi:MAG: hypothetical protein GXP46_08190 [Deferribacteres bacterium]|nr:hypothetical protein [Deferribacteres bacterium]
MIAETRLDRLAHFPGFQGEHCPLEFGDHPSTPEVSEVTAFLRRAFVL